MMEIWDLYTSEREPTGETMVRGDPIPPGCCHLVVHVWIQNAKGEWLISQRAASRPSWPLMWETVGGSVVAGENSLMGAIREAKEEVGVDLALDAGQVITSVVRPHNDIMDVWLFRYDGDIDLSRATTDEVAQSKWMTVEEIRALYDAGKLVPSLKYFFDLLAPRA